MSTLLETGGLSVRFGGVHALSDVDLKVEEGQLVGLIGPNGAGKTTFIDAITGFVPSTGSVVLEGTDITGMAPADRAHRGLTRTWQAAELFDDLTVRENLTVAARRASWRDTLRDIFRGTNDEDERVEVGAERLQLDEWADVLPGELTQGSASWSAWRARWRRSRTWSASTSPRRAWTRRRARSSAGGCATIVDSGTAMLLIDHDMGLVLVDLRPGRRARVRQGHRAGHAGRRDARPEGRRGVPRRRE